MNLNFKNMTGKRKVSLILWGILILSIVVVIVLMASKKPAKQSEAPPERATPVKVMLMKPRSITDSVSLPGRVESFEDIEISTERAGRIVEVRVKKGDLVTKGQILLRLDDSVWQVNKQRAEIEKREAEKDAARWQELKKTGAVSDSEYDNVIARRDLAAAGLESAVVEIWHCEVRSPIDGIVDDSYVDDGEYAREGMAVFRIVSTKMVKVIVSVPERDVLAVKAGDVMKFGVSTISDNVFTGRVSFISSQADRQSNSFNMELIAENMDGILKGGMIAEVKVIRGEREGAMIIPLAAIIPRKGKHIVFVANKDRAVASVVNIDLKTGFEAVISSGINEGDNVIVDGHRGLADGSLIKVDNADQEIEGMDQK